MVQRWTLARAVSGLDDRLVGRVWAALSALWVVFACCATPVLLWTVTVTLRASQAGATPAAAVYAVLASLEQHYDPELTKVLVFLADYDLRQQLRETRDKLASEGTSYRLEASNLREVETATGETVTVDVAIVTDRPGTLMFMRTQDEQWSFNTVHERAPLTLSPGWKVASMRIPDICTVYYTRC